MCVCVWVWVWVWVWVGREGLETFREPPSARPAPAARRLPPAHLASVEARKASPAMWLSSPGQSSPVAVQPRVRSAPGQREAEEASWREAGGRPPEAEKVGFQKMSGIAFPVSPGPGEALGSLGGLFPPLRGPPGEPAEGRPPLPPSSLLSLGGSNRHGMPC